MNRPKQGKCQDYFKSAISIPHNHISYDICFIERIREIYRKSTSNIDTGIIPMVMLPVVDLLPSTGSLYFQM